jgi:hypothetical protein
MPGYFSKSHENKFITIKVKNKGVSHTIKIIFHAGAYGLLWEAPC